MHYIPKLEAIYLPEGLRMDGPEIKDIVAWCDERIEGYAYAWAEFSTTQDHYVGGVDITLYGKEEQLILTPGRYLVIGWNYIEILHEEHFKKCFIGLAD